MQTRNTRQKELLKSHIEKMKGFFNAEELHREVVTVDDSIGLATIYRQLKQLVKTQELFLYTCDRKQVYSKTKQHCHYIDEKTGKITHFEIKNLDFLKDVIPGNITSIQIEVRGNSK